MRKVTNLFALLLMFILGAVSASADIAPGGHYTIRPFSAPTQYVVPSAKWDATGEEKAAYAAEATMDNGGVWLIQTTEHENGGFSFTPANTKDFACGYLNPWNGDNLNEGPVGTWKTNGGDDAWNITAVEGYDNVYTINNLNRAAVYLYYNADAELFYFNKPGSPAESNYFYIEVVPIQYTVNVVGTEGVTVSYKGQDITTGISTTDVISATDVTATEVPGYRYSVDVNNGVITVTYMEAIDTTKMYYLKNVDANLYVVLGASGNATISSTDKTKFRLTETEQGFTIQTTSGTYLGANSWNTRPQTEAFYWTVTKAEGGYTFYQNKALAGFMGIDATTSGSKIFCNKGANNHYVFALEVVPEEQTSYSVSITGAPEGTTLSYASADYANGETISTTAVITSEDITVKEIDGYTYRLTVGESGIEVAYTYVADRVLAKEDVNDHKAYYIYTEERGGITLQTAEAGNSCGTKEVGQTVGADNELMHFAFINYKEKLYLYSVAKGMFLCADNSFSNSPKDEIGFADASNYTVRLTIGTQNINLGGSNQMAIGSWSQKDAGNSFIIRPAADFDPTDVLASLQFATITVNYYIGERLYKSVENEVQIGETFQVEALPFTALAAEQEAFEVTEDKTINVSVTEDLPFEVSDPNSSDPDEMYKCGVLFVHANQTRYTFAQENEDGSFTPANDDNNRPESISPLYMWYITGNLIDGFKVWNYQADAALLASDNTVTFDDEGTAFELCTFSPDYNGNFDKLNADTNLVKSKKFTLHCDKGYVNSQGTEMKYWENADAGSTFVFAMVNDVNLDGTIDLNDVAALASCIAKGQPCYNGNINDDDVTSIADLTELIDLLQPVK